jgi:hypothetical protein
VPRGLHLRYQPSHSLFTSNRGLEFFEFGCYINRPRFQFLPPLYQPPKRGTLTQRGTLKVVKQLQSLRFGEPLKVTIPNPASPL